jgi:hypothetical protein
MIDKQTNEKPVIKGGFWLGFLLAISGWILMFNRNLTWDKFTVHPRVFLWITVILFVFWLPISIIAGVFSRKNKSGAMWLLLIISFFALVIVIPLALGYVLAISGAF